MEKQETFSQENTRFYGYAPIAPIALAILLVLFIVGLLIACWLFIPFVIDAMGLGLVLLTAMGIIYIGIRIWKYANRIEIKDIPAGGTIMRLPNGKLQIVAPIEIFAFETNEQPTFVRKPYYQGQLAAAEAFPQVFPDSIHIDSNWDGVYVETPMKTPMETPMETVAQAAFVEPVMDLLEQESVQAKTELEAKEDELIKKRIQNLNRQGFSLRVISKIVHLEGRKYEKFKTLCKQLGINTE